MGQAGAQELQRDCASGHLAARPQATTQAHVLTCNQVLEEEDRLGMWGPDIHKTTPFSALMQLSLALSLVGGFAYILSVTRPESPVAKRDYPYNGLEKELGGHGGARAEQPVLDDE